MSKSAKRLWVLLVVMLGSWSTGNAQKVTEYSLSDTMHVRLEPVMVHGLPDTLVQLYLRKSRDQIIKVYTDEEKTVLLYEASTKKDNALRKETYYYPNGSIKKIQTSKMFWVVTDTLDMQIAANGDTTYQTNDLHKSRPVDLYERYHPNGMLHVKGMLQFEKQKGIVPAGRWVFQSSEGLPQRQFGYDATNNLHGDFQLHYPNGKISIKGQYHHGIKTGAWQVYDYEGQLIKTINYR